MKKWLQAIGIVATILIGLSSCSNDEPVNAADFSSVFDALDWGDGVTTYVIGHKSPDTDATCSAITYSYLMNALGYHCEPRVAGKLNNETKMVLRRFGIQEPAILSDAEGERIIMVDHSEMHHAITGMDKAKILQIIDHHSQGSITTSSPLYCRIMPVGSCCTVIYTGFKEYGVTISKEMAGLLLSALLSDTNNLASTTTSSIDSTMYAELLPLTGIGDVDGYYKEMTDSLASYMGMTDEEIFFSDYKDYSAESVGCNIGVAVVNALNDSSQTSLRNRMMSFMPQALEKKQREMVFAMILNKTGNYTDIIYYGEGAQECAEEAFGKSQDGFIRCQGQMSRKNDFIPAISKVLFD